MPDRLFSTTALVAGSLAWLACSTPVAGGGTVLRLPASTATASPLDASGRVHVLIEIPAGTNQKWETAKDGRSIVWQPLDDGTRRVVAYLPYPGNYGMVPGTRLAREGGGDGDPLDVLLLGPARERGELVAAKCIGVLVMTDDGERDDKLLAVDTDGPFRDVDDVTQLDERFPGTTAILATWFSRYKGADRVVIEGLRGRSAALTMVEAATLATPPPTR